MEKGNIIMLNPIRGIVVLTEKEKDFIAVVKMFIATRWVQVFDDESLVGSGWSRYKELTCVSVGFAELGGYSGKFLVSDVATFRERGFKFVSPAGLYFRQGITLRD